ncbi:DsbA family oxidoreductase [bacterium]|nr:DsbA family oxidoreductase [bacterium]
MKIEIWSDVVCPWCYIGKRRFEAALKDFEHTEYLDIEWKSYQLDLEMQTDSALNIHQYLAERKGMSLAQAKAMGDHVTAVAAKEGLHYDFSKTIPVNTIKAHRLLHFAKTQNKQDAMKEALLSAYFTQGKNLDDNTTLAAIAKEVGLDAQQVASVLESKAYLSEVKKDISEGLQLGLRGVPFFVFDRKYGISGAQEVAVFSRTLEKAFAEWVKTNPTESLQIIDGKVCTPEGKCD